MSARNANKEARRAERMIHKGKAARKIPHLGVRIGKKDVLGHRYLAVQRLPFSASAAVVYVK